MKEDTSAPRVIEIKKYQNRRYYDTTNSQHLSLEKIHKLICQGYDVKVTDAKTGAGYNQQDPGADPPRVRTHEARFFLPGYADPGHSHE